MFRDVAGEAHLEIHRVLLENREGVLHAGTLEHGEDDLRPLGDLPAPLVEQAALVIVKTIVEHDPGGEDLPAEPSCHLDKFPVTYHVKCDQKECIFQHVVLGRNPGDALPGRGNFVGEALRDILGDEDPRGPVIL
jgi:hypothetical protein